MSLMTVPMSYTGTESTHHFFIRSGILIRVLDMMSSYRLTCILANNKGCALLGIPLFPEGGLEDGDVSSDIVDSGLCRLLAAPQRSGQSKEPAVSREFWLCSHVITSFTIVVTPSDSAVMPSHRLSPLPVFL